MTQLGNVLLSLRNNSLTVKNFPNRNLNQKLYPFCIYHVSQTDLIIQIFAKAKLTFSTRRGERSKTGFPAGHFVV